MADEIVAGARWGLNFLGDAGIFDLGATGLTVALIWRVLNATVWAVHTTSLRLSLECNDWGINQQEAYGDQSGVYGADRLRMLMFDV